MTDKGTAPRVEVETSSQGCGEAEGALASLGADAWKEHAEAICNLVAGQFQDRARRAAEDLYETLLYATQDYLRENTVYNIGSQLEAAQRQAASDRRALYEERIRVADLLRALKLAEDVLSRFPFTSEIWPDGTHPNAGIETIRAAIAHATGAS